MFTIYVIRHIESRRCYVGVTKNLKTRWIAHCALAHRKVAARTNNDLVATLRADGPNAFSVEPVDESNSREDALRIEGWWIYFLRSHRKAHGFNIETSSGPGKVTPVVSKQRMSEAKKGKLPPGFAEFRAKGQIALAKIVKTEAHKERARRNGSVCKGRVLTKEHKEKCGAAIREKWRDPEFVARVAAGRARATQLRRLAKKCPIAP